jgi:hypothetical protein
MASPNLQQTNLMTNTANIAYQLAKAFSSVNGFLALLANSPTPATLVNADFTAPGTPPQLIGLSAADFANFVSAMTAMSLAVTATGSANNGDGVTTIAAVVQTLAERANQI